jgi:hypothetical protein
MVVSFYAMRILVMHQTDFFSNKVSDVTRLASLQRNLLTEWDSRAFPLILQENADSVLEEAVSVASSFSLLRIILYQFDATESL